MVRRRPLGRVVRALSVTSLFTDIGTEMIFPLLPVFLTSVLGAGAEALGLIEGLADAVAALLKLGSGWLLSRWPRPKRLAIAGYTLSSVVRPLVALAAAPWHVLAVRVADRIGKGTRGTARDSLLSAAVPIEDQGRAFGLDRAADNLGALVGPLVASALLWAFAGELRLVFALAVVPGALAVGSLVLGVPADAPAHRAAGAAAPAPAVVAAPLPGRFWGYLAASGAFAVAGSSDAFLLLRAQELGVAAAALPLLWSLLNLSKTLSAYPLGGLADRAGKLPTLAVGFAWYAASYWLFARAGTAWQLWALFPLYGVFYGLTEGVGKAMVPELSAGGRRPLAFGLYNGVTGLAALPAGLLTGYLWKLYGGPLALEVDAALALVALAGLAVLWSARYTPNATAKPTNQP